MNIRTLKEIAIPAIAAAALTTAGAGAAEAACHYTIKVVNKTDKWVKLRHLAVQKKGKKSWVRTGEFGKDPGKNMIDHWFRHVYRLKPNEITEENAMFLARKSDAKLKFRMKYKLGSDYGGKYGKMKKSDSGSYIRCDSTHTIYIR